MGFGINVPDLDYADDIGALAADPTTVQTMLNEIAYLSQLLGKKINKVKSKVIYLSVQSDPQLVLYGQELEKIRQLQLSWFANTYGGYDFDV